jgi:PKHD-type hydroxylase
VLVHIPAILQPEEIAMLRERLTGAAWGDGRITAGHQSALAKRNLQIGPESAEGRDLGMIVLRALERSQLFMSAALPARVFPPLFNRYDTGMAFGTHIDNAVRQIPGTASRLRTDLSATIFLSDPDSYDGGKLIVKDTYGEHALKPAAGDLILYPARSLHRVAPVTRGSRIASFLWIQSMVKQGDRREMLFDLDQAVQALGARVGDDPALIRLTGLYHNLLREWGEP